MLVWGCEYGTICKPEVRNRLCDISPNCEYRCTVLGYCMPHKEYLTGQQHVLARRYESVNLTEVKEGTRCDTSQGDTLCHAATNCEYRINKQGYCMPTKLEAIGGEKIAAGNVTATRSGESQCYITIESAEGGLAHCRKILVPSMGVNQIRFGSYEPQWYYNSLYYDRCGNCGCQSNWHMLIDTAWAFWYQPQLTKGNIEGVAEGSWFLSWNMRNGRAEAIRAAIAAIQVQEWKCSAANTICRNEWKAPDYVQLDRYAVCNEDYAVLMEVGKAYVWPSHEGKWREQVCGKVGQIANAITGIIPIFGGLVNVVLTAAC